MAAKLNTFADSAQLGEQREEELDAETASRLAALGYVGHGAVVGPWAQRDERTGIDPKDLIASYNEIVRAQGIDPGHPRDTRERGECPF